jgi:hypothetical protein
VALGLSPFYPNNARRPASASSSFGFSSLTSFACCSGAAAGALTYDTGDIVRILTETITIMVLLIILGEWLGTLSVSLDNEVEKGVVGFLLSSSDPIQAGKVAEYLDVSMENAIKIFSKAK